MTIYTNRLSVGRFDTVVHAAANDLSEFDEIFTSGFAIRNDGGGAHYRKYDDAPAERTLGFTTSVGDPEPTHWGLIPDGNVINPLQAGAKGDGSTNDRLALQNCIAFVKWWRDTGAGVGVPTDLDSSQTVIRLMIPGNRTFLVNRDDDAAGLNLTGPIMIVGEADHDRGRRPPDLGDSAAREHGARVFQHPGRGSRSGRCRRGDVEPVLFVRWWDRRYVIEEGDRPSRPTASCSTPARSVSTEHPETCRTRPTSRPSVGCGERWSRTPTSPPWEPRRTNTKFGAVCD